MSNKKIKAPAASAFFGNPSAIISQPETATSVHTESTEKDTSMANRPEPSPEAATQLTLPVEPNTKKRLDKSTNILVNKTEYAEFTEIVKKLGYSNNAMINKLINDFVKANKI